jgi:hypothetical protein
MYINENIQYKKRPDLSNPRVQATWIEMDSLLSKSKTLICAYYRPPSMPTSYFDETIEMLDRALAEKKEMIMLGDFNWDHQGDGNYDNNPVQKLEEYMEARQIVRSPTRVTLGTSSTIDLILTTNFHNHLYTEQHSVITTCLTSSSRHTSQSHS